MQKGSENKFEKRWKGGQETKTCTEDRVENKKVWGTVTDRANVSADEQPQCIVKTCYLPPAQLLLSQM